MDEFHKIFHNKEDKKEQQQIKLQTNLNTRPYIDLNLGGKSFIINHYLDEVIEAKIKQVAEELVRKSHLDLNTKLTQRTKQIREYIDQ